MKLEKDRERGDREGGERDIHVFKIKILSNYINLLIKIFKKLGIQFEPNLLGYFSLNFYQIFIDLHGISSARMKFIIWINELESNFQIVAIMSQSCSC